MTTAYEKSERLLRSPMQRLTSKLHKFCMKHNLPRVHGCIWDRHCRWYDAPRRVALYWGRHEWYVDLPGYDRPMRWRTKDDPTMHEVPGSWQLLPQFHHYGRLRRL